FAGQRAERDVAILVNPGPVLEKVTPSTLAKSGAPVSLLGQGFQTGMTVAFGAGRPVEAMVLDAAHATAAVPKTPSASGKVDVVVANPDGGTFVLAGGF